MFFEIGGKTFRVKFLRVGRTYMAELQLVTKEGIISTKFVGTARCDSRDKFVKSTGRKIALADLLWQISPVDQESEILPEGLSKEDREKIWAEYFKNHKK